MAGADPGFHDRGFRVSFNALIIPILRIVYNLLPLTFFSLVFAMPLCASVYMCLVVPCWERADLSWLSFVVSYCQFVTFPLVSSVMCGTSLYRFLIFAPLLTSIC